MKVCYRYILLFLFFIAGPNLFAQSSWYMISENSTFLPIRGAMTMNPDLKDLFAVGDQGMLYETHNYGYSWVSANLNTGVTLNAIASQAAFSASVMGVPEQSGPISPIAIICGQLGTLIRFNLFSKDFTLIDTLTSEDLNFVTYDFFRNKFWLAGNNGFLASSDDEGQTWQKLDLTPPVFNIKKIVFDYSFLLLWGDDGNNIYVKKFQMDTGFPIEVGTDTIANQTLINLAQGGGEFSSKIYFISKSPVDSFAIWSSEFFNFPNMNYVKQDNLPINNSSGLSVWNDNLFGLTIIWITTDTGQIWQWDPSTSEWQLQFEDSFHRPLGPIISSGSDSYNNLSDAVNGVALGNEGMTVFNGFVILETFPPKGDLISGGSDDFIVKFSNIPNLPSLSQNLIVKSNYFGLLPVTVDQDAQTRNEVHFFVQRPNGAPHLPGEKWQITLSAGIFPEITDTIFAKELKPTQFSYSFFPEQATTFEYVPSDEQSILTLKTTTNWITAFINEDEFLDLVTYSQDTLHIFMSDNVSNRIEKKIFLPGVRVNPGIEKQLKVSDVNHDALPDLLLYDDTQLIILINNSQGIDANFYQAAATYTSTNIRDIIPYNEDNNADTDLMILSDELSLILNISESLIDPSFQIILQNNARTISKIQVGDIDGNFVPDLIYLDGGNILSILGDSDVGLRGTFSSDTLMVGDYVNFMLADLDHQPPSEIVCLNGQRVDAISYLNRFFNETNYLKTLFLFSSAQPSEVVMLVDDFGGDPYQDYFNLLDIAMIKRDSLLIFNNLTDSPGNLLFSEVPVFEALLPQSYNQVFTMVSGIDFLPQMVLVNRFSGTAEFWKKGVTWLPQLSVTSVNSHQVSLSWFSFPPQLGTLDYYEVQKSRDPFFENQVQTFTIIDTNLVDNDVWPYEDYWYRIRAVYNGGFYSSVSEPIHVSTYYELNGEITGVLADTSLPYIVLSDLVVPQTDSLLILNGVEMAFMPNTGMRVYGAFSVRGNNEQQMANFFERDSLWKGIYLYQNADTALFEWFSIHGAKTGLTATGRPFKMHLGGITKCETALRAEQLDFWMENFLIDSVYTGIQAGNMVNGNLKNIDILHARDASVFAFGVSNINIKNAILWHNQGPLTATDSAKIFLSYSTVDNIGSRVFANHISKLPPLFTQDLGEDAFMIDPMSPTIDAGDPNDPYDLEPQPNGGRINQGTLGNTHLAAPSYQPRIDVKMTKIELRAFAGEKDSTILFLKNKGFVDLRVDSLAFKNYKFDSVFTLDSKENFLIAPQDSLPFRLMFTPTHRGTFFDSLVIFCNDPHLLAGRLLLPLQGTGLNSRPVLINQPPVLAFVDSLYRFKPELYDSDGDTVLVDPVLLPQWLKLNPSGELIGTPAVSDTGKHIVRLLFDDQHGGIDSLQYVIQVFDLSQTFALVPLVKAFPVGGVVSHQAAISIVVTVFDSTQNKVKEATQSYHFYGKLYKEGQLDPIEQIDTSGVRSFKFYPLMDGNYKLHLLASKTLITGKTVEAATEVPFLIRASQKSFARFRWHMVTYPRPEDLSWATLEHKDSAAVLYRWDALEKKYFPITKETVILPGWAFWLMPLKNLTFDLNAMPMAQIDDLPYIEIKLKKGWNQVGLPWPYYKRWVNVRFAPVNSANQITLEQALADTLIQPAAFWFEQNDDFIGYHVELFDSNSFAKPWTGYWLYANTEASMFVDNGPEFPFNQLAISGSTDKLAKAASTHNEWLLNFSLESEKLKDDFTVVGFSDLPGKPILEPPVFNEFASFAVTMAKKNYCKVLKPWLSGDKNYAYWDLTVTTSAIEKEHRLSWQQLVGQSQNLFAYLIDLENETMIDLGESSEYNFTPESNNHHFRLYVSCDQNFKPSIIPLQYTLAQNFPNPFNPTTTIKIGIPETGTKDKISVRVFDVLGKEIRVLFDGTLPAGFHEFEWDGTNATGDAVASGIYFYQLRAGQLTIMKKMILLR